MLIPIRNVVFFSNMSYTLSSVPLSLFDVHISVFRPFHFRPIPTRPISQIRSILLALYSPSAHRSSKSFCSHSWGGIIAWCRLARTIIPFPPPLPPICFFPSLPVLGRACDHHQPYLVTDGCCHLTARHMEYQMSAIVSPRRPTTTPTCKPVNVFLGNPPVGPCQDYLFSYRLMKSGPSDKNPLLRSVDRVFPWYIF